jgi:hypothetical protein
MGVSDTAREEAIRVALGQIHGQPAKRSYTTAEVKHIVYPLVDELRGPVVPVPTREQIREAIAVEMEWANGQDWDGLSDHEYLVVGSGHLADAVLALFSPVEGNTK